MQPRLLRLAGLSIIRRGGRKDFASCLRLRLFLRKLYSGYTLFYNLMTNCEYCPVHSREAGVEFFFSFFRFRHGPATVASTKAHYVTGIRFPGRRAGSMRRSQETCMGRVVKGGVCEDKHLFELTGSPIIVRLGRSSSGSFFVGDKILLSLTKGQRNYHEMESVINGVCNACSYGCRNRLCFGSCG